MREINNYKTLQEYLKEKEKIASYTIGNRRINIYKMKKYLVDAIINADQNQN